MSFVNLPLNNLISLWLHTKYKYCIKSPKLVASDGTNLDLITNVNTNEIPLVSLQYSG